MALSNSEAWARATDEVRASIAAAKVGDVTATRLEDTPTDDVDFWDAVESRAVELGGHPAGRR